MKKATNWIKSHPYQAALVIIGVAVLIYFLYKWMFSMKKEDAETQTLNGGGSGASGGSSSYVNIDAQENPTLKRGVMGEKVKELQIKLNASMATMTQAGKPTEPAYESGTIGADGYFGEWTEKALVYVVSNKFPTLPDTFDKKIIQYSQINTL